MGNVFFFPLRLHAHQRRLLLPWNWYNVTDYLLIKNTEAFNHLFLFFTDWDFQGSQRMLNFECDQHIKWRIDRAFCSKLKNIISFRLVTVVSLQNNSFSGTSTKRNTEAWRATLSALLHATRSPSSLITSCWYAFNLIWMRKQGRPRNSWRRSVDKEAAKAGYTWNEIEKLARDRRRWREVSLDLCSAWSERG